VKHLIVAVGGECYLTFPKGQLVPTHSTDQGEKSDDSKVPGGGHVLIVPIAHVATLDSIPGELRASVIAEYTRLRCVRYTPNMARQLSSSKWPVFHLRGVMRIFKLFLCHFPLKTGSSLHSGMRAGCMALNLTQKMLAHPATTVGRVIFEWSCLAGEDLCIK
jgi:hypothetical protein